MEEQSNDLRRPTPSEPKKSRSALVWIILNIVQLGVICFLLFIYMNQSEKVKKLDKSLKSSEQEVVEKTQELFDLRDEYIRIKKEKKRLGLDLEDLNKQLEELDGLIQTLQTEKQAALSKIKNLDAKIASMRNDIVEKDAEIAKLKEQNDSLYTEIDTLEVEKQQITEELETSTEQKIALKEYIKAASVLKTDEIIVNGIKSNGKEFHKDEYRGRSLDRIRIKFNLVDNKAATKEKKDFYIRLITPSGATFSDPINGGGTVVMDDGKELEYTMKKSAMFDNSGQEIEFTMLKGFNYKEGNYIVEVVCDGFKIGQGYFIVK